MVFDIVKARVESEDLRAELAEKARAKFRTFARMGWNTADPSKPFVHNWHIDAVCDHLQACADLQIKKLLINVPPGTAKSLIAAVHWPAWMWTREQKLADYGGPKWRGQFASYKIELALRDSVKCRSLIQSQWYQELFRPKWKFSGDQNVKSFFENTERGFRFTLSVGSGTGFRGNAIVCLAPEVEITTSLGRIPIGEIVEKRLPVQVLAYADGVARWRGIEEYESSAGRPCVRVKLSDGTSLECTEDHLVFVPLRGYTEASKLQPGDHLLSESGVQYLRGGIQSITKAYRSGSAPVLQPEVCREVSNGQRECAVSGRESKSALLAMPGGVPGEAGPVEGGEFGCKFLFSGVFPEKLHRESIAECTVPAMRGGHSSSDIEAGREEGLLLSGLRQQGALALDVRGGEPEFHSRSGSGRISSRVPEDCTQDTDKRFALSCVREGTDEENGSLGRAPYRLRQAEQRSIEPDFSLQGMPREGAWRNPAAATHSEVFVVSVEPIDTPERVYNIRVSEDHNYFANGHLVHNCDDPISADDALSDAKIEEHIYWWDHTMSTRLNDMQQGVKVVIMQRLSDKDLSGHILASQAGYEHLCLPMEFEIGRRCTTSIGWTDPREKDGELLFPKMFPTSVLEEEKRVKGESGYAGQYQQRPVPIGGGMLKRHWWKFWQPRGLNLPPVDVKMPDGSIRKVVAIEIPEKFDVMLQSWDMAFKDEADSDFVVGQVLAAKMADRFILDQVRDRMDLPKTLAAVKRLSMSNPGAYLKLVEDKANGPAVIQSLSHKIGGFIAINPLGNKISRAAAASPMLQSGNWYLPHPDVADWVEAFLQECTVFPKGANDDQVDAWSQGAARLEYATPAPEDEDDYLVSKRRATGSWAA